MSTSLPTGALIQKLRSARVLVAGDIILDLYVRGEVERVSPEAPVPVILEKSREYSLGGAGNVARNAASLGGRVTLMGAVGDDPEGKMIATLCKENAITPHLITERARPTSHKTRAVAGQYQLLRIDREKIAVLGKVTERKTEQVIKKMGECDVVVISDYAKGFVTQGIVGAIKKQFGSKNVIANIKPSTDPALYRGIQAITLNAKEGQFLTGVNTQKNKGAEQAVRVLAKKYRTAVILTRGEHGLTVCDERGVLKHIPARLLHVFDVTGAGDTVIATFALMRAIGMPLFRAAEIANRAGGIVVGVHGTATVTINDLESMFGY